LAQNTGWTTVPSGPPSMECGFPQALLAGYLPTQRAIYFDIAQSYCMTGTVFSIFTTHSQRLLIFQGTVFKQITLLAKFSLITLSNGITVYVMPPIVLGRCTIGFTGLALSLRVKILRKFNTSKLVLVSL